MDKRIAKIVRKAHKEVEDEQIFITSASDIYARALKQKHVPAKVQKVLLQVIAKEAKEMGLDVEAVTGDIQEWLNLQNR